MLPFRRSLFGTAVLLAGVAGCAPRPQPLPSYVLFFTSSSSQLDPEAVGVVQDAANAARAQGNTPVVVQGYSSARTGPASSQSLADSRSQRVADQLVSDGVARARITLQPQPLQGDPDVVSRRVEILVQPR